MDQQQVEYMKNVIRPLLITSFISVWLCWLWSRRGLYKFAFNFPGDFGLPIVGSVRNVKEILQQFGTLFDRTKSNNICIWMGLYPTIVSSDPEFTEKVLTSPELLKKSPPFYAMITQSIGQGLVTSPVTDWKYQRKLINPSFHHKVLVGFLPVFHKGKDILLSKFDEMSNGGNYKLCDLIHSVTLGISIETTMGKKLETGKHVDEKLGSDFKYAISCGTFHLMLCVINLGSLHSLHFKYKRSLKRITSQVSEIAVERLKRMKSQAEYITKDTDRCYDELGIKNSNIFIDQAIENYHKQKTSFNDVITESNHMVTAAFETTGSGVFNALLMLAMHPTVQERLYEEITNTFPRKDFEMRVEDLAQLPYLEIVINETLRLFPGFPIIAREVTKDFALSKDVVLPKGLQIALSIFHLHRRPDIWGPNAEKFDPDRFLPENIAGRHPYAYIPFSKGARNCIGWRYGLISMKIMLAGIVRNYRLTTSAKYEDIRIAYNVTMKHLNEPSFKIYRRE